MTALSTNSAAAAVAGEREESSTVADGEREDSSTAAVAEPTIRVLDIRLGTSVDGPGLRTSIYCAGCENRCAGCHNPQSWDPQGGEEMSVGELFARIVEADMNVTFTGGDPMLHPAGFAALARMIRERTDKTIWCYTGYSFERLMEHDGRRELALLCDVIVDGPYVASERDLSLRFRGSRNQRIIDVDRSLCGEVTLMTDFQRSKPSEG